MDKRTLPEIYSAKDLDSMGKTMIESAKSAERYNELVKIELAMRKHIDWLSYEINNKLHMYNNTRGMNYLFDHEKIKHEADILDRVMQNLKSLLKPE